MEDHVVDVLMALSRILIGEMSDAQLIELREVDGDRCIPIVVGVTEAFAIERRIKKIPIPRPMTHELLSSVILSLGARLDRVVIHDLTEGTFYAVLCLERDGAQIQIDARPSDAIALSVGGNVPIYVSEDVLAEVQLDGTLPGIDLGFDPGPGSGLDSPEGGDGTDEADGGDPDEPGPPWT